MFFFLEIHTDCDPQSELPRDIPVGKWSQGGLRLIGFMQDALLGEDGWSFQPRRQFLDICNNIRLC